jgi:type II restriction enzyme
MFCKYKTDFRKWANDGYQFIWITDGAGWKTNKRTLRETFNETDYILNMDILEKGILEKKIIL